MVLLCGQEEKPGGLSCYRLYFPYLGELLYKCNKSVFLWMQESSWNNLISIPLVIFNGFQDEPVAMYSFFTYKFAFEPSWIFCPVKSKVFAKAETRGTVGKAFMQMKETTKPGGPNVYYLYIFLEVIIVISFLDTACFRKKWLYSNKYLFIKLAVTEVDYELLKCQWGAGLFYFCEVSVENKNNVRTCSKVGEESVR